MKKQMLAILTFMLIGCDSGITVPQQDSAKVIYLADWNLHLADVTGRRFDSFTRVGFVARFSPKDLKCVYYKRDTGVKLTLIDLQDNSEEMLTQILPPQTDSYSEDVDWSVDGEHLVYSCHKDGQSLDDIYLFDLQTKKERRITSFGSNWSPALSHTNEWVACLTRLAGDSLFRLRTIRLVDTSSYFISEIPRNRPCWLADGSLLIETRPYGLPKEIFYYDISICSAVGSHINVLIDDHQSRFIGTYDASSVAVLTRVNQDEYVVEEVNIPTRQRRQWGSIKGIVTIKPELSMDSKYLGYVTLENETYSLYVTPVANWRPNKIAESRNPILFSISVEM